MTGYIYLCQVSRGLLSNRCIFVQLNDKKSRWRSQKDGLPQGSVFAVLLFNIYTNDQPLPTDCSRFIYADDLCITTQQSDVQHVEHPPELALDEMSIYYVPHHNLERFGRRGFSVMHRACGTTYRTISASLTLSFFLSVTLRHIYLRQHFQIICKHVLRFFFLCLTAKLFLSLT